jgi:hypothetical protein
MPICNNCGVELEARMKVCPLCGYDANAMIKETEQSEIKQDKAQRERYLDYGSLTRKQRRKLFWELSGIILLSGIIVTFIIDFITNKNVTWSRYSITVCFALFVNITLISFLRRRIFLLFAGSFISTSILLILLDLYNHNIGWGTQLGIPFLFSFYVITLVLTLLVKYVKYPGFNILAYFFIAIGVLTICVEGIISKYEKNVFYLHWSIIVLTCMIPIAAILLFIHFRLKKGIELKRFFNI